MRWLPVLVLGACGAPDPCVGSELAVRGLVLGEDHLGWGSSECFDCHVRARIHQASCLPDGAVDATRSAEFPTDCESCHGPNGQVDTNGAP